MTIKEPDIDSGRLPAEETRRELRTLLTKAQSLLEQLEDAYHSSEIVELRNENDYLTKRLIDLETQNHQMLGLYVSTYQLYDARDPGQVVETIAEITRDILGAQRFLLIVKLPPADGYSVAMRHGLEEGCPAPFVDEAYAGGVEAVDRALGEGERWLDPHGDPMAVIPLQLNSSTVGALVLFELLSHKKAFSGNDGEIIDLLGAHAASALMASESWAAISRRVNTLESLLRLARGVS